jgi:hypothetical protein
VESALGAAYLVYEEGSQNMDVTPLCGFAIPPARSVVIPLAQSLKADYRC